MSHQNNLPAQNQAIDRRKLLLASTWAAPAVVLASALPAAAVSLNRIIQVTGPTPALQLDPSSANAAGGYVLAPVGGSFSAQNLTTGSFFMDAMLTHEITGPVTGNAWWDDNIVMQVGNRLTSPNPSVGQAIQWEVRGVSSSSFTLARLETVSLFSESSLQISVPEFIGVAKLTSVASPANPVVSRLTLTLTDVFGAIPPIVASQAGTYNG